MADENYVRLSTSAPKLVALAGACPHPKPKFKNGKERQMCFECRPYGSTREPPKPRIALPKSCNETGCDGERHARGKCVKHYFREFVKRKPRPPKAEKECPACRGFFTPKTRRQAACSKSCAHKLFRATLDVWRPCRRSCTQCGADYLALQKSAMYCSGACKTRAFDLRRDPTRVILSRAAMLAAAQVRAKARRESREQRRRAREVERSHRAALRLTKLSRECKTCGIGYSTLHRDTQHCCSRECSERLKQESKRALRSAHKAIKRAATVEKVIPYRVFQGDGWRCYLCGCETPEALRGTYEPNAPELEHMIPLSRGGAHSYANTRCACRACNLIKGDRTVEEVGGAHQ